MSIKYDRTVPYNNLPLLPPDNNILTTEVMQAMSDANKQLSLLRGIAKRLPNQSMLLNTIMLRESKASNQIENIFTTDEELYKAASGSDNSLNGNAKEVLRYREAMWSGYNEIKNSKRFTLDSYIRIYQEIKQESDGIRSAAIDLTTIKKRSPKTIDNVVNFFTGDDIVYTPPRGENIIRQKMENLIDYLNDDKTYKYDPLIKLAVGHYQFEAIHPFRDGNGRTGRIANILFLTQKQLLDVPILYLSEYIIKNKDEYYQLLNAVTTRERWEDWIIYMMKAVEYTSSYTIVKIQEINQLIEETTKYIQNKIPKISNAFIIKLFEQPYIVPSSIMGQNMRSINTVKSYLRQLEELKILAPRKVNGKNIYLNVGLFDILSES